MPEFFDALESRDPEQRERDLLTRLPALIGAACRAPGWRRHLGDVDPRAIDSRAALAQLPVLRKSELPGLQKADPPFGGFVPEPRRAMARWFASPGPIFEPEGAHDDAWRTGRAVFAAGLRRGDVLLNTFSYHQVPGGFIFDSAARAVGCVVIPAGPGNTEQQIELIAQFQPRGYAGTPDFLKILLDAAEKAGKPAASIKRACVSGAAFPPSLQNEMCERGVDAYQTYATADLGCIAFETEAREGLVCAEDLLIEVVRPGTGDPVAPGEVGEVVVTSFDHDHPWIRLALGDLSAVLPGISPCGRSNTRIRGWLGRADQTTKVKGMFVRPEQVAQIARRHPEVARLRLVVGRQGETDVMLLRAEVAAHNAELAQALAASLRNVTQLGGTVELLVPGALPNDGKVIEDTRSA
jgi:phenylacetate-CoA ligase